LHSEKATDVDDSDKNRKGETGGLIAGRDTVRKEPPRVNQYLRPRAGNTARSATPTTLRFLDPRSHIRV